MNVFMMELLQFKPGSLLAWCKRFSLLNDQLFDGFTFLILWPHTLFVSPVQIKFRREDSFPWGPFGSVHLSKISASQAFNSVTDQREGISYPLVKLGTLGEDNRNQKHPLVLSTCFVMHNISFARGRLPVHNISYVWTLVQPPQITGAQDQYSQQSSVPC